MAAFMWHKWKQRTKKQKYIRDAGNLWGIWRFMIHFFTVCGWDPRIPNSSSWTLIMEVSKPYRRESNQCKSSMNLKEVHKVKQERTKGTWTSREVGPLAQESKGETQDWKRHHEITLNWIFFSGMLLIFFSLCKANMVVLVWNTTKTSAQTLVSLSFFQPMTSFPYCEWTQQDVSPQKLSVYSRTQNVSPGRARGDSEWIRLLNRGHYSERTDRSRSDMWTRGTRAPPCVRITNWTEI